MSSNMTTISNQQLQEKYFYPVQQGVYVATNHRIKDKTPAQMIMDRDTCVVYLVDSQGQLYMQPAEMFPKEILNAPLWKTIPLPREEFHRQVLTPPVTPPSQSRPHAHQQGYVPSLATYTGKESSQWVTERHRRDSQTQSRSRTQYVPYVDTTTNTVYYLHQQQPQSQPRPQQKTVRFAQ